ncbi:MAG: excinuclease ABC subunit C [Sphingobacteriaceae bacterium]|nr:excinuclease ABC subunit C [Sphingobacteriaceae bacterium]
MSFYTYILYSSKWQRFYKGSCADVQIRLARHNSGGENATAAGRPWRLIWFTTKESRSEAVKLELKLKNLSAIRLIQFIEKYQEHINPTEKDFWNEFISSSEAP